MLMKKFIEISRRLRGRECTAATMIMLRVREAALFDVLVVAGE